MIPMLLSNRLPANIAKWLPANKYALLQQLHIPKMVLTEWPKIAVLELAIAQTIVRIKYADLTFLILQRICRK